MLLIFFIILFIFLILTYLLTFLLIYLIIFLFTDLSSHLSSYLPTFLLTDLSSYLLNCPLTASFPSCFSSSFPFRYSGQVFAKYTIAIIHELYSGENQRTKKRERYWSHAGEGGWDGSRLLHFFVPAFSIHSVFMHELLSGKNQVDEQEVNAVGGGMSVSGSWIFACFVPSSLSIHCLLTF